MSALLPAGWAWATLGEVSRKPQYGWTTKANADGRGVRLLRTTDITSGTIDWSRVPACTTEPDDMAKYLLAADDIVVSRAGSVGASIRIKSPPPPSVFASYLIRLRPVGIEPAYMGWFLQSERYWRQIRDAAAGIALLNVNAKKLSAISMPVPPLNEQRRIVAAIEEHLSRLDAADASLVTAERRTRLFRDSVLEEALTNGAPRAAIGTIASLTDGPFGSNLKTSHYVAEGPRVVRLQNIGDGVFHDERAHITREHFLALVKHSVVSGDVIVASLGDEAPRACLVPEWLGDAIVKADCIRLRPDDGVDASYVMWALNSRPVKAQAATRIKGIGRPRLGLGGIRELEIPLPPLEDQRRIVAEVEEQLSVIDAMRASIERVQRRSRALRAAILERAFRGELVPQDPADEPAEALLARIRAGREERAPACGARRRSRAS